MENPLQDNRLFSFVDNYGAQDCMIKGSANVDTWRQLLLCLEEIDENLSQTYGFRECRQHPTLLTVPADDHLAS